MRANEPNRTSNKNVFTFATDRDGFNMNLPDPLRPFQRDSRGNGEYGRPRFEDFQAIPEPETQFLGGKIYNAMQSGRASSFADVTLISSDRVRFDAVRMHLAVCSSYFEKLLNSEFAEKNMSEIEISIHSYYLQQILEFIYIDDCTLVRNVRIFLNDPAFARHVMPCQAVRSILKLGLVADYVRLDRLVSRCETILKFLVLRDPYLATAVLGYLHGNNVGWGKHMFQKATQDLCLHTKEALLRKYHGCDLKCGVMHLSEEVVEHVFEALTKDPHVSHSLAFQALVIWTSSGTALGSPGEIYPNCQYSFVNMAKTKMVEERCEKGKHIAKLFNVNHFTGQFLHDIVEPSGLINLETELNRYKKLCLRYEKDRDQPQGSLLVPMFYQ